MKLASVTVDGVRRAGLVDGQSITLLSTTVDDIVRGGATGVRGEVLPPLFVVQERGECVHVEVLAPGGDVGKGGIQLGEPPVLGRVKGRGRPHHEDFDPVL